MAEISGGEVIAPMVQSEGVDKVFGYTPRLASAEVFELWRKSRRGVCHPLE